MKLSVHLHPKSSKRKANYKNNHFEIYVHAPPENNKANKELIVHTAKALGLAKSKVSIVSGHKSRTKVLEFPGDDLKISEIREKLERGFY